MRKEKPGEGSTCRRWRSAPQSRLQPPFPGRALAGHPVDPWSRAVHRGGDERLPKRVHAAHRRSDSGDRLSTVAVRTGAPVGRGACPPRSHTASLGGVSPRGWRWRVSSHLPRRGSRGAVAAPRHANGRQMRESGRPPEPCAWPTQRLSGARAAPGPLTGRLPGCINSAENTSKRGRSPSRWESPQFEYGFVLQALRWTQREGCR